jgi:inhibitor of KinA
MAETTLLQFDPLGDQAVLVHGGDEPTAFAFAAGVREKRWPWVEDVVQAYNSVAVFYRADLDFFQAKERLTTLNWREQLGAAGGKLHVIPCCYDLGLDFDRIVRHTKLSRDEIVALHVGEVYVVYALGFCPGFPYLGYLPEKLTGVPRLESPRLKVDAGSVGLTGRQTGIYSEARPGGWNIIGRTPLELVNVADGYFPLRTGDRVQFRQIGKVEFRRLQGSRLVP